MNQELHISKTYRKDIQKAIKILKEAGCSEVFLFGSITSGEVREKSDIDLAVRGCPQGKFFHLIGKLMMELDNSIDLVRSSAQGE